MSHSDVVERVAKWYDTYPYNRCGFWRSYFKKRGWKWNVIWKDLGIIIGHSVRDYTSYSIIAKEPNHNGMDQN